MKAWLKNHVTCILITIYLLGLMPSYQWYKADFQRTFPKSQWKYFDRNLALFSTAIWPVMLPLRMTISYMPNMDDPANW